MTLAGIDVSAAGQGAAFPWSSYKGKIQFAGVKISQATDYGDPDAKANIAQAHALGLPVIGYHFLVNGHDGAAQAEWYVAHAAAAGLQPERDLIAFDAEDAGLNGGTLAEMNVTAEDFTAEIRLHKPGYWPMAYTEISMAPSLTSVGNCPLWLANPSGMTVKQCGPWKLVSAEQTGQRGVDTDVFYGTAAELAKLAFPA